MTALRVIKMNEATQALAKYAQEVSSGPIIVTENGKPIAAVISLENIDAETISLSTNPQFLALIEQSRARLKAEGGVSSEDMRRRLGLN